MSNCGVGKEFFDRKFNDGNPISRPRRRQKSVVARLKPRHVGNEGGAFFILKCRHILLLLLLLSCETLAFQFTISFLRSDSKQFDASSSFLDSFRVFRQFPCILTTGEYLSLTSLINLKKKSLGVVFFELRNAPDSFSCAEFYSASRIDRSGYDIRICKFRPEFLQPVLQPVKVFKLFFFVINYRRMGKSVIEIHREKRNLIYPIVSISSNRLSEHQRFFKVHVSCFFRGGNRDLTL